MDLYNKNDFRHTIKGREHETIVSRKGILGEEPTGGKAGNLCTTRLHSVALT